MVSHKNRILSAIGLTLLVFCSNFGIFLFGYRRLAFEHLSEWQRMQNADYILGTIVGCFALVAIATGLAFFWIQRPSR